MNTLNLIIELLEKMKLINNKTKEINKYYDNKEKEAYEQHIKHIDSRNQNL